MINDKKLLLAHEQEEPHFPRDHLPTRPLRASSDRRTGIEPTWISALGESIR